MPLKAAIIGCGKIGWEFQDDPGAARFGICTHAAAWSALDHVELTAVGDVNLDRAVSCAERWQVPAHFQSLDALLASSAPDIVSIATPDACHYDDLLCCLAAPSVKAVLIEKPAAFRSVELEPVLTDLRQSGKSVIVNFSRRFCPFYVQLRERILTGEFGALRLARNVYTKGILHNGSHFLDLMQYFFGTLKPRGASRPSWHPESQDEFDPGMDANFVTSNGASVVMHHLPAEQFTVFEIDLCFEKARFIFTDGGDTVQEYAIVKDLPFEGYSSLTAVKLHEKALHDYLLHAVANVAALLRGDASNLSPLSESVSVLRCLETLSR